MAGTLSGGEQQMLAMGRALMSHPKIILMDEPSSLKGNASRLGGQQPCDRMKCRGFPGTIGAYQSNYLTFIDIEGNTFNCLNYTMI